LTTDVLLDVAGPVATVTMNRPDLGNAVTPAQAGQLAGTFERLAADPSVRVVVLTGSGSSFNVGAYRPANSVATAPAPMPTEAAELYRARLPVMSRVVQIMYSSHLVTIAAVNGACAGAGLALALAADFRYAAESARFNTGFLSVGFPGELGAIWHATRLVGPARARELFLLPEKLTARQVEAIGLVNGVHEGDELLPAVIAIASRLAGAPSKALAAMKANLVSAESSSLPEHLSLELSAMLDCIATRTPQGEVT
jgi:2-(1,2-epoxy-1,2-dihydrophenyl)acetyl-CoA isomerase